MDVLAIERLNVEIAQAAGALHPVQDVSLRVGQGETVCVVGESGCGKSLTALAVMDLLPRRASRRAQRLEFMGEDLLGLSSRRMSDVRGRRMAMIFQEPMTCLNPCYTVGDQLSETLVRHQGASRRAAMDRAAEMLEKVGIRPAGERLRQYPHQLSGGLRQRVMIAMALMCSPALIIADEPTTALDVTIQAQILVLLAELQREFHMGAVLITHDLSVVARVASRVVVMYAGQVVETGDPAEIFNRPAHPYTQGLLRCLPVPGRVPPGSRLGSIPGLVPTLMAGLTGCHFRNRCPLAREACRESVALRPLGPGREMRCVLEPAESGTAWSRERP